MDFDVENPILKSFYKPEVELRVFRACAEHKMAQNGFGRAKNQILGSNLTTKTDFDVLNPILRSACKPEVELRVFCACAEHEMAHNGFGRAKIAL